MKTLLKVLLIVPLAVLSLRLAPAAFGLLVAWFAVLLAVVAIGLGLVAALFGAGVGLIVALAPIWLPVLAIVGIIALLKKPAKTI